MTFKLARLTFYFSTLSLVSCGGGSSSSSSTETSTGVTPTATNAAPVCTSSAISFSRGSGTQSLLSAVNCSDSDNDTLSYDGHEITTAGVSTGEHEQNVTVSDGQGNQITVTVEYSITNQAPSCQQSTTPSFIKGSGLVDLSGYINCDDPNNDVLSYSNNTINPDDLTVGNLSHSVTVSDGELATIFAVTFTVSEVTAELTRCEQITQSVSFSGESDVSVTCDQEFAYITSDTYPTHDLMNGITGTNEQVPVPAVNYAAPIKLNPVYVNGTTTIDAAVGVAVNGVPIYDYSAQGELDVHNYDPSTDTLLLGQLDNCGGHSGRGDDYHYHVAPSCMVNAMTKQGDDVIIGWGYDGYPLYGDNNPDGSAITSGELDVCNSQEDGVYGRRYHTSQQPPYIIQCLVGDVDTQNLPRVSPLQAQQENHRADLKPPQEGVENLTFTEDPDGTRTMRYDYQGESYYTIYSPTSGQNNCYQFEMKTITGDGQVTEGTYCR